MRNNSVLFTADSLYLLNLSQTSPGFYVSAVQIFWKQSNFSFSHSVFYSFWELSIVFIKIEIVVFLRTKSVTKKEMNKCVAEIYDPGGIRTRAARLISQYHNYWAKENSP